MNYTRTTAALQTNTQAQPGRKRVSVRSVERFLAKEEVPRLKYAIANNARGDTPYLSALNYPTFANRESLYAVADNERQNANTRR